MNTMTASDRKPGILFGPDRKIRLLWRAVIFYVLADWLLPLALNPAFGFIARTLHVADGLTPANVAIWEIEGFVIALIGTAIFAWYEGRRVDSYGLPIEQALGARTWEGALVGVVMAGAVAVGMYLLGGMQIRGLATTGSALVLAALAWLGANVCVGLAEEFFFRSYLLQTLWKSMGFSPGAIVIALAFTADHYFFKTGENIWDVITLISLSLMMSYSVVRTGTLWFAVGFHIAFDYMQLFVIGTPNGAQVPQGSLLAVSFNGPSWLTGGVLGTEASFLMYPAIALAWLYIWWRYRPHRKASGTPGQASVSRP
jgi:membrane protease YdiL (CAAX protease family)